MNFDSNLLNLLTYALVSPAVVAFGLLSNAANLWTLANARLQSVPFVYIRAIGYFDCLGLCLVAVSCVQLTSSRLSGSSPVFYPAAVYFAHVEIPLINALFAGSLFSALAFTVERYRSLAAHELRPLSRSVRWKDERRRARVYVTAGFALPLLLYVPVALESVARCSEDNPINDIFNCTFTDDRRYRSMQIFRIYSWIREALCRLMPVSALTSLNAIIVYKLGRLKRGRNLATKIPRHHHRGDWTDKRIGSMIAGVTLLYILGNIPQAVSIAFYSAERDRRDDYRYQIFRSVANVLEICNHSVNFFVFLVTSGDYRRAFAQQCRRLIDCGRRCRIRRNRRESVDTQTTRRELPTEQSIYLVPFE